MRQALVVLDRIRRHRKRGARIEFAAAERARLDQEERVHDVAEDVRRSFSGDSAPGAEAAWLAQEQGYRLRRQLDLRRESAALAVRAEEAETLRAAFAAADREARLVEILLDELDRQEEIEDRRADARRLDGVAAVRWWRGRG